jgi:hypothetical protein
MSPASHAPGHANDDARGRHSQGGTHGHGSDDVRQPAASMGTPWGGLPVSQRRREGTPGYESGKRRPLTTKQGGHDQAKPATTTPGCRSARVSHEGQLTGHARPVMDASMMTQGAHGLARRHYSTTEGTQAATGHKAHGQAKPSTRRG